MWRSSAVTTCSGRSSARKAWAGSNVLPPDVTSAREAGRDLDWCGHAPRADLADPPRIGLSPLLGDRYEHRGSGGDPDPAANPPLRSSGWGHREVRTWAIPFRTWVR